MYHLGIGAAHRGKEILAITDMTGVTVIELRTGEVLSARDIDPACAYWRSKQRSPGRWPGAFCHLRRDSDVIHVATHDSAGFPRPELTRLPQIL